MAQSSYQTMNDIQETIRAQILNTSQLGVSQGTKIQLGTITGSISNPPQVPTEEEDAVASKLRRADPSKIQFNDLMVGDVLSWNNNSATVITATSSTLSVMTPEGLQANWAPSTVTLKSNEIGVISLVGTTPSNKLVNFDSVILPTDKKIQIIEAISQVDNHNLIFEEWGFGDVFEKGTAISLLFYGLPGTGKTLMAQAIADKYGKKLVMVSTAEIETPEPGGAERNIQKYFSEAQKNGSMLLFDECDSLITDRQRVGMILAAQINALLTELERYTGIVVFTTNRLGALDPAFDRRLSLKLEFPMPDAAHRTLIWQRMFPSKAPVAKDVRWDDLGQIPIAGGHIKNVVLKAARKAATTKAQLITDDIIWECLENEVASQADYTQALDDYNPWMGTPLAGQGRGLSRQAVISSAKGKNEVQRD